MLLTFVWDKTASGTARSKTSVLLLTVPEAVLSHTKTRSRSGVQSIKLLLAVPEAVPYNSEEQISFNSFCVPRCPRCSLVPYKSVENQFHPVLVSLGLGAPMPGLIKSYQVYPGLTGYRVFHVNSDIICTL